MWTVHRSDVSPYILNQHTHGKINDYHLLALALLRILFKPVNPYALFTVSLLSLKEIISQAFLSLETLSLPLQKLLPLKPNLFKWSLLIYCSCFMISLLITCYICSGTIYVFRILGFMYFMFSLFFVLESLSFWLYWVTSSSSSKPSLFFLSPIPF